MKSQTLGLKGVERRGQKRRGVCVCVYGAGGKSGKQEKFWQSDKREDSPYTHARTRARACAVFLPPPLHD